MWAGRWAGAGCPTVHVPWSPGLATAADFDEALGQQGLPRAYPCGTEVHQAQQTLPGRIGALEDFRRSLPVLFETCRIDPSRDGFASLVTCQPASFGLPAGAGGDQLRAAIRQGLEADPDLAFHLLPAGGEPQAADGTRLFPPEQSETVVDSWIWCVRCPAFFPGPPGCWYAEMGSSLRTYGRLLAPTPTTRWMKRFTSACPGWTAIGAAPWCRSSRLYPVRTGESSSRRSRLIIWLLLRADRPGSWKVFANSGGFPLPDCCLLNPDASLLPLKRWQALTAEQRRGFAPGARIWW